MADKHFILYNIHFTQRCSDNYIDATQMCQSKKKMFANWFRTKKAKLALKPFENALYKNNRHTWIIPDCVPFLLNWLLRKEVDFTTVKHELDKPFPEEEKPPITSKVCSKCHEDLPLLHFGKNKRKKDGYDIRCKNCYKEERQRKADHHASRTLEYYHENKKKCNAKRAEWVKKNRDKVNAANRRAYAKKKAIQAQEEKVDEVAENIMSNITLMDKKDNPHKIICRESDGYINVTNLCKAGGRHFKTWNRRTRTQEFLKILKEQLESEYNQKEPGQNCTASPNSDIHIELVKYDESYGKNRGTWVHPKVAINIAQWISPKFDVQVSTWIHKLLVVGEVKMTDGKDDKRIMEIQKGKVKYNRLMGEGKEEEAEKVGNDVFERIKELEEKNKELELKYKASLGEIKRLSTYLERKRRKQYDKGKCIYVMKHKEFKDMYKVGISNNLTSRMSTYNTAAPENFELIYTQHTVYNSLVETMVKKKLIDYLYVLNKEWYEIVQGPDVLIDNIKRAVEYFENN